MPDGVGAWPVRLRVVFSASTSGSGFHLWFQLPNSTFGFQLPPLVWFGFHLRFWFPPLVSGFRFPPLASGFHLWFGFPTPVPVSTFGFGFRFPPLVWFPPPVLISTFGFRLSVSTFGLVSTRIAVFGLQFFRFPFARFPIARLRWDAARFSAPCFVPVSFPRFVPFLATQSF